MFETMEEELKQFLRGMRSLNNLKSIIDDISEDKHPVLDSLETDFKSFMRWAFNTETVDMSVREAKKIWKDLHPNLEIPRVLKCEKELHSEMATVCLFMDAYPQYLASKKSCNG